MPDGTIYPMGLPPPAEMSSHSHNPHHPHHPHPHHPALWHPQAAAAAALAMGLTPSSHHSPHSLPPSHPMMQQQQRNFPGNDEGITRSASFSTPTSSSSYHASNAEWDSLKKQRSSRSSLETEQHRDLNPPTTTSKAGCPSNRSPSSTISSVDAAAMKAAAAAAQGNMMMSMMMMGRPLMDAHNDPFIGHAFAAAAKERIGGRTGNNAENKGDNGEPHDTNGLPSSPSPSSNSTSPHPPPVPSSQSKLAMSSATANQALSESDPPTSLVTKTTSSPSSPSRTLSQDVSRVKSTSPDAGSQTCKQTRFSSDRGSPMGEDNGSLESFGHKKFDKFRKVEKGLATMEQQPQTSVNSAQSPLNTGKASKNQSGVKVKEEALEQEMEEEDCDEGENKLNVDLSGVKVERTSPRNVVDDANNEDTDMSPVGDAEPLSPNSAHSPNSGDRPKLSAKEAHPNLLAHLMNGGNALKVSSSSGQAAGGPSAKLSLGNPAQLNPSGASMSIPWNLSQHGVSAPIMRHSAGQFLPQQHQTHQMFKHPSFPNRSQPANSPIASPSALISQSPTHRPGTASPDNQKGLPSHENNHGSSCISPSSMQHQELNSSSSKKEEFHAAAVSNLKDKILRKYDSMENLHKISKGDSSPSPSPSQPFLTSSQSSSALLSLASNSNKSDSPPPAAPITGRSNSIGNTEGLNKELATKLTICSMASAETSRSCSPQDIIARPSSLPSSSSAAPDRAIVTSSYDSRSISHHAQPGPLFSPGLPHPASALTQIPQMLLSQGIHPANLSMYHSMLARGIPPSTLSSATPSTGATPEHFPHNGPLASMQRFADFFTKGNVMEPGEKR